MNNFIKIIIMFLIARVIFAQGDYSIHNLGIADGLSQSSVLCMMQDDEGYVWIGTFNGLNRYDGYSFKVFVHTDDSTSISENVITGMFKDSRGNLWFGAFNGVLNKYDRKTNGFIKYDLKAMEGFQFGSGEESFEYPIAFMLNANNTITAINEDENGNLIIGSWGNGLIFYNLRSGSARYFFYRPSDTLSLSSNYVTDIFVDKDEKWVATYGGGINKIISVPLNNKSSGRENKIIFKSYLNDKNNTNSNLKILDISKDESGRLWLATQFNGVYIRKTKNSNGDKFEKLNSFRLDFPVMDIVHRKNKHWLASFGGGIFLFDNNYNLVRRLTSGKNTGGKIIDNEIVSLLIDKTGLLWAGGNIGGGISILNENRKIFNLINSSTEPIKLSGKVIWSILRDKQGELWIGSYRGGLNRIDLSGGKVKVYKSNSSKFSISGNHIRSIAEDKYGNLWVGAFSGGLNFFDRSKDKFYTFYDYKHSNQSKSVQAIHIDDNSDVWVGFYGGGISRFDLDEFYRTGKINFENFRHKPGDDNSLGDDRVYCITEDDSHILWIGFYGGGVGKFDKLGKKFINYKNIPGDKNSLSGNKVVSIFQDSKSGIWIGTYGGGLNKYNPAEDSFVRFTENLGEETIYGILEDSENNLWISSDNGIIKFNPSTNEKINYTIADGLQSMEYCGGSYFKDNSGIMYFGGINGVNYFSPDDVKIQSVEPNIAITSIKIFDKEISADFDTLALSYNQNFFSFQYSALDFTDPANNKYAYKLDNFDPDWRYSSSNNRTANYTNVPPGEYTFRVKGANWANRWSNYEKKVYVIIYPPYYKTWWFIALLTFTVLAVVYLLISFYFRQKLSVEKLKTKLSADLHDNVGSGLTEISILSELAANDLSKRNKKAEEKVKSISETARNLIDAMSDIVWVVNPGRDSLYDLTVRLKSQYSELLSEMNILFETTDLKTLKNIRLPLDMKQNIYLILKEAVNNSIKHSKCKKISLEITSGVNSLEIIISDDGIGFDENSDNIGNGLINIKKRGKELNAKLTIVSKRNSGTEIKLSCPLNSGNIFNNIFKS